MSKDKKLKTPKTQKLAEAAENRKILLFCRTSCQ